MKINVDKKNNRVIADGYYRGKRIRSIAHCMEPEFNDELGVKLATKKFKIKEKTAQKIEHEKRIKELHRTILWCFAQIDFENKIVNSLDNKIQTKLGEYKQFVEDNIK